jgi:hypothetical protein
VTPGVSEFHAVSLSNSQLVQTRASHFVCSSAARDSVHVPLCYAAMVTSTNTVFREGLTFLVGASLVEFGRVPLTGMTY